MRIAIYFVVSKRRLIHENCSDKTMRLTVVTSKAESLNGKSNIKIPVEERAAFAKAVKGAMDALAKQA